jgi:hypothetical protein
VLSQTDHTHGIEAPAAQLNRLAWTPSLLVASSSCLKMIVAQLMLVCSVAKYSGLLGLSCHCGGNDFVPDREAGGHLGSPLGCTDQMTTGPKVLPDVAESKQEPLSLPR